MHRCPIWRRPLMDPYKVLGVAPGQPFSEVRERFHELARAHHPDMTTGDPVKFRAINEAYQQLRAAYRSGKVSGFSDDGGSAGGSGASSSSGPQTASGEFWDEQNRRMRHRAREEAEEIHRRQRQREEMQRRANTRSAAEYQNNIARHLLWVYNGYEWILLALTLIVVCITTGHRLPELRRARERRQRTRSETTDAPEGHVEEEDIDAAQQMQEEEDRYEDFAAARVRRLKRRPGTDDPEARQANHERRIQQRMVNHVPPPRSEGMDFSMDSSSIRRATQRKFADFREFLFLFDEDSPGARRVTTTRLSHQYVKERDVTKRCPIVRTMDARDKEKGYQSIQKELLESMRTTAWPNPDQGVAGWLVARGIGGVPANAPAVNKWTFIEYQDLDESADGALKEPVCLAAVRNLRFDEVGIIQRVQITGRPSYSPRLVTAREEALKDGTLRARSIVAPQPVPLKDLSIPLEKMKL